MFRSKKQETRNKKQETRNKRQETRGKKQETKKKDTRSKIHEPLAFGRLTLSRKATQLILNVECRLKKWEFVE